MGKEGKIVIQDPEGFFTSPAGHPRDRIIMHETIDIPREGQYIALNGFGFLAKPGVEIDLPRPVRLMLDTRITTDTLKDENGKDYFRNRPRFPYTLIKENVQPEPKKEGNV